MNNLSMQLAVVSALFGAPAAAAPSDCGLVFEIYAHALSNSREAEFANLIDVYSECMLHVAETSADAGAALKVLRAHDQIGDRARVSSYDGVVKAHPLIIKASFFLARGLKDDARLAYVSSMVRTPDQQRRLLKHPILKRVAIKRSKHVLGGLAVDMAFIGRKHEMQQMGRRARRILRRELGGQAAWLRVAVEPYCLHIEIDQRHPVGRRIIERRKRELVAQKILVRPVAGIPSTNDYRTERTWKRMRGFTAAR